LRHAGGIAANIDINARLVWMLILAEYGDARHIGWHGAVPKDPADVS